MPGRDGTGPRGLGMSLGKKMGWCNGGDNANSGEDAIRFGAAFGRGRGRGLGLGYGFGCGCGRGRGQKAAFEGNAEKIKELLSEQKEVLQKRIEFINKKLENL